MPLFSETSLPWEIPGYVSEHRGIKLVTTEKWNYLVLEPNYQTTKFFTENLLAIEMKNWNTYE